MKKEIKGKRKKGGTNKEKGNYNGPFYDHFGFDCKDILLRDETFEYTKQQPLKTKTLKNRVVRLKPK